MIKKNKENIGYIKQAWLVLWNFHGNNDDKYLERELYSRGIKNKVIDILNTRRSYDKDIIETAKDIYRQTILYPSEKIPLANYNNGSKNMDNMFGSSIPIFTIYDSDIYRKITKEMSKDIHSKESKRLLEQWKEYPKYVIVGHNPYLEIIKVKNITVYKNENGTETIEWDRPLMNNESRHESYEWK